MANFSEGLSHFVPPDSKAVQRGITAGMVVLDSNVLLSAYRFAPKSRAELLDAIALANDRLWILHQVSLEFHRNRLKVIAEHDSAYRNAIDLITERRKVFLPDLDQRIRELSNRVALPEEDRDNLLRMLHLSWEDLRLSLEELRKSHGVGKPGSPDPIFERLNGIFAGKVGDALPPDDEKAALAEATLRVRNQVPPGYKDSHKDEPHGDYFVWYQTLLEARRRDAEVLIFVTNDTKEDWYTILKGQAIAARPELARECLEVSGARLIMLPTRLFLSSAKKFLSAAVSDETIRQAEKSQVADDQSLLEALRVAINESEHHESATEEQLFDLSKERTLRQRLLERALAGAAESQKDLEEALDGASLEGDFLLEFYNDRVRKARQEADTCSARLRDIDEKTEDVRAQLAKLRHAKQHRLGQYEEVQRRLGTSH